MSGWGTGWGGFEHSDNIKKKALEEGLNSPINIVWDLATGSDEEVYGAWTAEGWKELSKEEFENKFRNSAPTHDPYTNPNAHIYYECGCGAILDPGTKSFAQLNNCASDAGWKVRWGADSYVPCCVKCGEDIE